MLKFFYFIIIILSLSLCFLMGCASRGKISALAEDKIIETSGKKSDWVNDSKDFFKKGDDMFFRGRALEVSDVTLGLNQSEGDAKKRIVGSIKDALAREVADSQLGDNKSAGGVGFFSENDFASATGKVQISGVFPFESYYERKVSMETEERYYNCYSLLRLSEKDYKIARKQAIEGLIAIARQSNNKKAEEAALELKRSLENGE